MIREWPAAQSSPYPKPEMLFWADEEQMRNNEEDPLGEKRFGMESWTLSQDAVEIKSLVAFRKKNR